ncbi:MAG: hypothetical protein QM668_08385 [Agriterribacter sp.]
MKRICLTLFACCCLLFSCKKEAADTIQIRVQNATPLQIEQIHISGGADAEITFESLPAGFTTGYRTAGSPEIATPQCKIYVRGLQDPFVSSDNDLSRLRPGQYTCHVTYINALPAIKFTKE